MPGAGLCQEPQPPCAGPPSPAPSAPEAEPKAQVWFEDDLDPAWRPAPCLNWPEAMRPSVLVALSGSFRHEGSGLDLLTRFGRISELERIRYWSITRNRWNWLFSDAYAVAADDWQAERPDFTQADLMSGTELYFMQNETGMLRPAIWRLRVQVHEADQLEAELVNAAPLEWGFIQVAKAGQSRGSFFLERERDGVWRFYSLAATVEGPSALFLGGRKPYLNRALAMFRHFAGIPTDREPPIAP